MKAFIAILLVAAVSGQFTNGVDYTRLRQLYLQGQYQKGGLAGLLNNYGTGAQGGLVEGGVFGTGFQGGLYGNGVEGLIYGKGGLNGAVYGKGIEGVVGTGVYGGLTTGQSGVYYTLAQLYGLPVFQEYLTFPLFRQYLTVPAFQRFLVSQYFQQYFTLPIFQDFFRSPVLFYQYIFPVVRQFETVVGGVEQSLVVPEIYRYLVPEIYRTGVVPQVYSGIVPETYNGRYFPVGYNNIIRSLIAGGLTSGVYGKTGIYGNTGVFGNTGIYGNNGVYGNTGFYGNRVVGNTGFYGNGIVGNTGIYGTNGVVGNTDIYGTTGVFGATGVYGKGVAGTTGKVFPVTVLDSIVKGLLQGTITVDQLQGVTGLNYNGIVGSTNVEGVEGTLVGDKLNNFLLNKEIVNKF
jgi:hypothetical protein